MIQINLLPEEFRIRPKSVEKVPYGNIILLLEIIFVLITLYFYVGLKSAKNDLKNLEEQWQLLQPDYRSLTQLQKELEGNIRAERSFMERFVTTQRPLTNMLMWLSELLPDTAWLTEVSFERQEDGENLMVKGLASPSGEKSSIEQIEIYLHQLKEKMPETELSLTTTRQMIQNVELTLFIANFNRGKNAKGAR